MFMISDGIELLTPHHIAELLRPYATAARENSDEPDWDRICRQLAAYLQLILKWNSHVNLTAIRSPEEIVRRHFGESLFAGTYLGEAEALLDFGSGAGFPGVPIQILRPELKVTLAESRGRKAAFLREAVRALGLDSTEVWPRRVEEMPASRQFEAVTLRAVDEMNAAVLAASERAVDRILILGTRSASYPELTRSFREEDIVPVPGSSARVLRLYRRILGLEAS